MKNNIIEIVGWYGTVAILLAYAGVSFGWFASTSFVFQVLNFTGAIGIVAVSYFKHTYQPAVLNFIWAIIALVALGGMLFS